jgi:tripartite-type tricarboxylate transporter receptor subunit TctC
MRQSLLAVSAIVFAFFSFPATAAEQAYPAKPIRLISGFAAGGGLDATARPITQKLVESLGQQFIIDNRPGAGGNLAAEITAKARPDGYTLLLIAPAFAINFGLNPKLPFDLERDFTSVTQLVDSMNIVSLHPSVNANSIVDLINLAKAKPLSFGSSGVGTVGHLAGELFNLMAVTRLLHIAYRGGGPVLNDLLGGQIQVVFASAGSVLPQIKAGKIRGIAVTTVKRSPLVPELPTVAEAGLPGYEAKNWYGLIAPAKTPRAIVTRLNREIARVLALPDVKSVLSSQGLDAAPSSTEAFDRYLRSEREKWSKVIAAAGVKPEY